MLVQVITVRLVKTQKSGALSCLLIHSCSAMDRHMQHSVFHTIAFLAFSYLAFSTPATWCRIFMSRKFMSHIFSVPDKSSAAEVLMNSFHVVLTCTNGATLYVSLSQKSNCSHCSDNSSLSFFASSFSVLHCMPIYFLASHPRHSMKCDCSSRYNCYHTVHSTLTSDHFCLWVFSTTVTVNVKSIRR